MKFILKEIEGVWWSKNVILHLHHSSSKTSWPCFHWATNYTTIQFLRLMGKQQSFYIYHTQSSIAVVMVWRPSWHQGASIMLTARCNLYKNICLTHTRLLIMFQCNTNCFYVKRKIVRKTTTSTPASGFYDEVVVRELHNTTCMYCPGSNKLDLEPKKYERITYW